MVAQVSSLPEYQNITPLCEKGHVVLVKKESDGNLYVKKQILCYNPEVYLALKEHPVKNTPKIYAIYEGESTEDGNGRELTIIEEYLPGSTLAEHLKENGVFSEKDTMAIAMQLCQILMELHGLTPPMIHRDIKPSNIMLLPDGTVKLLDFNAAKREDTAGKQDTVLLGTAGFAAPEQYGFQASSAQTDIYAVGVLVNTLLCGTLPSEQIAGGKLRPVILRCLELNPKDRYRDVRELYQTLKRMSKVKYEWLPPGFRTLNPFKMLAATCYYLIVAAVIIEAELQSFDSGLEREMYRITMGCIGMLTLCFFTNYLNMRRYFPFMRSRNWFLRLAGYMLGPAIIYMGCVMVLMIVEYILM